LKLSTIDFINAFVKANAEKVDNKTVVAVLLRMLNCYPDFEKNIDLTLFHLNFRRVIDKKHEKIVCSNTVHGLKERNIIFSCNLIINALGNQKSKKKKK